MANWPSLTAPTTSSNPTEEPHARLVSVLNWNGVRHSAACPAGMVGKLATGMVTRTQIGTYHQLKSHRGATCQVGVRAELERGKALRCLPGGNGGKAGHGNGDEDPDGVGGAQKGVSDGQRAEPAVDQRDIQKVALIGFNGLVAIALRQPVADIAQCQIGDGEREIIPVATDITRDDRHRAHQSRDTLLIAGEGAGERLPGGHTDELNDLALVWRIAETRRKDRVVSQ